MSVATSPPPPSGFVNPLADSPTVLVGAAGEAEGSRGAAAALACAGADVEAAALLVDVGGRAPRPTLIASAAAQRLEDRLKAHLPSASVAARGQVCHLTVPAEAEGLSTASAAVTAAREAVAVLHVPPGMLRLSLSTSSLRPSGVLLRADLERDRALVALAARELIEQGFAVAVLKRQLSWVAERRALFGVLPPGSPGGLSERLVRRLIGPGA